MRRLPGPIEPYCLIKNKFPSNLFFFVFYYFFIFCLPIRAPAAQSVRESPAVGRRSGDLQLWLLCRRWRARGPREMGTSCGAACGLWRVARGRDACIIRQ